MSPPPAAPCRALAAIALSAGAAWGQPARIPFAAGTQLTWVTSIAGEPDYESVMEIVRSDSAEATIRWSWNRGEDRRWKHYERVVSARERRLARSFYYFARENDVRQFRGTTPAMISAALLAEVKRGAQPDAVLLEPHLSVQPFRGRLRAAGAAPPVRLLLDGREAALPAVRVAGSFTAQFPVDVDLLVLDDVDPPWILRGRTTSAANVRGGVYAMVRVETGALRDRVADALRRDCRATVRDIYFATGSDAIDETSGPGLQAIAEALAGNPSWRLTVTGYTDSIGTAAANLELSARRAARVVGALRDEHHVVPGRLTAAGRGETQPAGDNGTIEGRAASRRVELTRECPSRPARPEES